MGDCVPLHSASQQSILSLKEGELGLDIKKQKQKITYLRTKVVFIFSLFTLRNKM